MTVIGYATKGQTIYLFVDNTVKPLDLVTLNTMTMMDMSDDPRWMTYRDFMESVSSITYKAHINMAIARLFCNPSQHDIIQTVDA
jgi:uncharacterized membrane protein